MGKTGSRRHPREHGAEAMKHIPNEDCLCEVCTAKLIRANAAYLRAWVKAALKPKP